MLIAAANTSFNTQATELRELSADAMQLDRTLALYGPETREARDTLRKLVVGIHLRIWPPDGAEVVGPAPSVTRDQADELHQELTGLAPKTEAQHRALLTALELGRSLTQTRS